MNFRENFINDLRCNIIIKGDKTFKDLANLYGYPQDNGANLCKKDYYRFLKSCHEKPINDTVITKGIVSGTFEGSVDNSRDNSKTTPDLAAYKLTSFKLNKDGQVCDQWFRSQSELTEQIDYKELFKEVIEDVNISFHPNAVTPQNQIFGKADANNLLVINATDVHLNKKCFNSTETLQDQIEELRNAVRHSLVECRHPDRILYIIGHDMFHSEYNNMTTKGTPQDTLVSSEILFKEGLKVLIETINLCSTVAPTDVILCNGNHAYNLELHLLSALQVYYDNIPDSNITVKGGKEDRQYYSYYENAFMLIHDTRNKVSELPLLFGIEAPSLFIKKNKYILSGHLHSKKETHFVANAENYGIEHIQTPSLSGIDKWHHDNMYIGNKRRLLSLEIHPVKGIVKHIIYNANGRQ
jgi:hypothetical protein